MLAWGLGHICAIAVGLSLGLLGGGGAILAVPILVYVIGASAKSAIAVSLVSIGTVSAIGAFWHWQQGRVRFDIAILFAPAAMIGAYLGASMASVSFITESFQLLCFGVIMLFASLLMIAKSRQPKQPAIAASGPAYKEAICKESGCQEPVYKEHIHKKTLLRRLMIPIEGLGIGVLTGFVGIGGGFAIVPALVLLTDIPMKQAVGTSLLIISLKSITGFLGYLDQLEINWALVISFTLSASLGTLLGSYLSQSIDAKALQAGFGYFVLFSAVLVLFMQFSSL